MGIKFTMPAAAGGRAFYEVAPDSAQGQVGRMNDECSTLVARVDGLVRGSLDVEVPHYPDVAEMISDFFEHEGHEGRVLAGRVQTALKGVTGAVAAVVEGDEEAAAEIASTSGGAGTPTVRFGSGGD